MCRVAWERRKIGSQSLGILLLYDVMKAGVVGLKIKGNVIMIMQHFIGIGVCDCLGESKRQRSRIQDDSVTRRNRKTSSRYLFSESDHFCSHG